MKRLSIKTSRILVSILVILLPLAMSLSVSAKVAVPLPEIPDENAEPVQPPSMGCPQAFSADGYRHPLQEIKVENSKELENPEKHRVIFRVLESPDVQNVLRENSAKKIDLWTYQSWSCTSWNGSCLIQCGFSCGGCLAPCGGCITLGYWWLCSACASCALGCGWCTSQCCQNWESVCPWCGTP